jgi:hypothetical protein
VDAVNERVDVTLAAAWRVIQQQHSAVPDTAISIVATGLQAPCGAASWRAATDEGTTPDIVLSVDQLREGAESVFTALLHEAAHGIAVTTKAKGTTNGRKHTIRYVVIAEQLGLDAAEIGDRGYAFTTLTPAARTAYAGVIGQLAIALDQVAPTNPTSPPLGHAGTHVITVYQRPTADGGSWIGVNVCLRCEPQTSESSPRRTFSINTACPQ